MKVGRGTKPTRSNTHTRARPAYVADDSRLNLGGGAACAPDPEPARRVHARDGFRFVLPTKRSRTLEISCEAPIRSGFVSFISLFGSSFALRVLRGRVYRAVCNPATRNADRNRTANPELAGTASRDAPEHPNAYAQGAPLKWVLNRPVPDASLESEAFHSLSTGR